MTAKRLHARRSLLRLGVAGAGSLAAAALLPPFAPATAGDSRGDAQIVHTGLSDALHLFTASGGNVVALAAPEGVLLVGKAGTKIIAHENTRLWLGTRVDSKWEHRIYPPQPSYALPTQTFFYGR
jgi:hypothetical protein